MTVTHPTGVRYAVLTPLDPAVARAIAPLWWPIDRLGEGLEALARRSGLCRSSPVQPLHAPAARRGDADRLEDWFDWAADRLGVEAEPVDAAVPDVGDLLRRVGPAVILLNEARGAGFVLLLGSRGGHARLLSPDSGIRRCSMASLRTALCWSREAPLEPEVARLLEAARVPVGRRRRVRDALLRERLASDRLGGVWILRLPASAGLWRQLVQAGAPGKVGVVLAVFALVYGLEIVGWSLIGGAALEGRLDFGWLAAWLLLVATVAPWRLVGAWFEAGFALDAGRILKSRLLAGALAMDPERATRQGVGHLIGRVMEAQALESLALNGGMAVVVGMLELAFAAWVLSHGAAAGLQLGLLGVSLVGIGGLSWAFYRRLRAWSGRRLSMTNTLIEDMVGHRTRLAQQDPGRRDVVDDRALQSYVEASTAMDRSGVLVLAGLPSAWVLVAVLGLIPAFVVGAGPAGLAISLGGMLVAQRAFAGISSGLSGLARAVVAWSQVSEIVRGAMPEPSQVVFDGAAGGAESSTGALLEAHGLSFRYDPRAEPVILGADLTIGRADRILLEGASGGGKSTLAALLTGLRSPQRGIMLLNGLDRHTLGDAWRRLVSAAPQFHQNHILSGPLAFNLLMGRRWPPSPADLIEAEAVCEDLGLGDLIRRMPAGLLQTVGETGWQLSHGERGRIFLARALLQDAALTVLDETFAALDPETLSLCLQTTLRRARALVVIAHP